MLFVAAAMLGACSQPIPARIEVQDASAGASAPGQRQAAAYLTLRNDGGRDERLRSVRIEGIAAATVHESSMTDGVMRMRPVEMLDLPAGATVAMAPGGLHVMLTGLTKPLGKGDKLRATLLFEKSPPLKAVIPVISSAKLEASHSNH
jgi:hypothetical protein